MEILFHQILPEIDLLFKIDLIVWKFDGMIKSTYDIEGLK